ncbi:acyltransferase domain protein [Mycobacterium kansasii 662]|uniref:Acyltransferase domain protein n=1 Tax=Mycobacterium kansasii 662 TaxID=1299326 RepID=X7YGV3_MYCKA|nr:acyltransferase domain protein [Mycobacterium kansasii 662]
MMVTDSQRVGGTRSFLPAVEGMRACAGDGRGRVHAAFQTGHSSGVAGRLFGRFDLAVAVFFRAVGIPAVARARGGGTRCRTTPTYGSLSAIAGGSVSCRHTWWQWS